MTESNTEPDLLLGRHCRPLKGIESALPAPAIDTCLTQVPGWRLTDDRHAIRKEFRFADYFHTIAFVNAVASIAHREDHHPDLVVGSDHCGVTWSTHSAGGLTRNDYICAARTGALVDA